MSEYEIRTIVTADEMVVTWDEKVVYAG